MQTLEDLKKNGPCPSGRHVQSLHGFEHEHLKTLLDEFKNAQRHKAQLTGTSTLSNMGHYSKVLTHKDLDHMVIKLSKSADCAYTSYLEKVVIPQQSSPFVPHLHGYARLRDSSFIVVMERLKPLDIACHQATHLMNMVKKVVQGVQVPGTYGAYAAVPLENLQYMRRMMPDTLFDIAKHIRQMSQTYYLDIKQENFMQRTDGTLVITDPLAPA